MPFAPLPAWPLLRPDHPLGDQQGPLVGHGAHGPTEQDRHLTRRAVLVRDDELSLRVGPVLDVCRDPGLDPDAAHRWRRHALFPRHIRHGHPGAEIVLDRTGARESLPTHRTVRDSDAGLTQPHQLVGDDGPLDAHPRRDGCDGYGRIQQGQEIVDGPGSSGAVAARHGGVGGELGQNRRIDHR